MAVLVCEKCGSKVESNRCCEKPMQLDKTRLVCNTCKKTVNVNRCCGKHMTSAGEN